MMLKKAEIQEKRKLNEGNVALTENVNKFSENSGINSKKRKIEQLNATKDVSSASWPTKKPVVETKSNKSNPELITLDLIDDSNSSKSQTDSVILSYFSFVTFSLL